MVHHASSIPRVLNRCQVPGALYQSTDKPFFLIEAYDEGEHQMTEEGLQAQAYGAMLGGAMGQIFGNTVDLGAFTAPVDAQRIDRHRHRGLGAAPRPSFTMRGRATAHLSASLTFTCSTPRWACDRRRQG
ncbi:MAG: hypothetical protein KC731_03350 [Myxococcales bacterium]|nr:hypothetical protein [Myxococcales bacterium]